MVQVAKFKILVHKKDRSDFTIYYNIKSRECDELNAGE